MTRSLRLLWICCLLVTVSANAQDVEKVVGPDGTVRLVPAGQAAPPQMRKGPPGPGAPQGPPGQPPPGAPPGAEAPAAPGQPPAGDKAAETADSVRPKDPTTPANPAELKVRADDDGLLAFSFRNQPWPALMEWLADVSQLPLDWQELPSGYVNLASPGRYTVAETRDLFNRHLLARGYTLLELDGGLTVIKTAEINPANVPRIEAEMLQRQQPFSFVRTSFDCGWLLATKLAEEFQPLISANGKLIALPQTNRLEAMDAAINLQQIQQLLNEEQSAQARQELAREFELRHIPAEDAKKMLSEFLGIKEEPPQPAMSPQQMRQMQMMQQQMMQQNGGQMPPPQAEKKEISLVVNARRNSILINAPPDRMAIAAQFIVQIDVPGTTIQSLADIEKRVEVLRLTTLDPKKLAEIVGDMNILEPATRLRVDETNQALIVSGSAADRFIVKSLAERLDGSARRFEVLQLRRLEAQEVAESIQFLMGTEAEEDNRRNPGYFIFGGWGEENNKNSKDSFRVAANVRYRQVLLWANESEMEEVRSLLIKLGELPPDGGSQRRVRLFEASATPETLEYLQRLREQFETLAPNPIELPSADAFRDPIESKEASEKEEENAAPPDRDAIPAKPVSPTDDEVALRRLEQNFRFAVLQESSTSSNPPIRIQLDGDGNLMIFSEDTKALDLLENLMLQDQPPKRPYNVFRVRNASATWMVLNLEDFFEEQDDEEQDPFLWFLDFPSRNEKKPAAGLGGAPKLRFVADNDTGSIVVTGASSSQLKTIGELIELWDVPEPVDRRLSRFTRLVPVRYSRAEKVAETIKEAYRDLLSSNDKAFSAQPGGGGGGSGGMANSANRQESRSPDGAGSPLVNTEGGKDSGSSNFTFKGKLSIGVDPVGNTLLVSAEGQDLLDLVCEVIDQVDKAATPQGDIKIHQLPGTINVNALETALRMLNPTGATSGDAAASPRNNAAPSPSPEQPVRPQPPK